MPLPLPILPASSRFYDDVTVVEIQDGHILDGEWVPGAYVEKTIQGSFQPRSLNVNIVANGEISEGGWTLYTREYLPFYDNNSQKQCFVTHDGMKWRITGRENYGPIAHGLYVYQCERYEEPGKDLPE